MSATGRPDAEPPGAERAEVERLQARLDDLDAGLAATAHELRAPLASIEGYLELLLDGTHGPLTPEQAAALQVVGRNAQRLHALVADLGATRLGPAPEPASGAARERADLAALVGDAVDLVRPSATLGAVALRWQPPAAPVVVDADRPALEGAVVNVLGNAVKYTPAGGAVAVRLVEHEGSVTVEVVDTGIGVPDADLAHLTEPGFRATNALASQADGHGLGLALVRDVVDAHGGELSVSSTPGAGTTVRLRLPTPAASAPGAVDRGNGEHATTV